MSVCTFHAPKVSGVILLCLLVFLLLLVEYPPATACLPGEVKQAMLKAPLLAPSPHATEVSSAFLIRAAQSLR